MFPEGQRGTGANTTKSSESCDDKVERELQLGVIVVSILLAIAVAAIVVGGLLARRARASSLRKASQNSKPNPYISPVHSRMVEAPSASDQSNDPHVVPVEMAA